MSGQVDLTMDSDDELPPLHKRLQGNAADLREVRNPTIPIVACAAPILPVPQLGPTSSGLQTHSNHHVCGTPSNAEDPDTKQYQDGGMCRNWDISGYPLDSQPCGPPGSSQPCSSQMPDSSAGVPDAGTKAKKRGPRKTKEEKEAEKAAKIAEQERKRREKEEAKRMKEATKQQAKMDKDLAAHRDRCARGQFAEYEAVMMLSPNTQEDFKSFIHRAFSDHHRKYVAPAADTATNLGGPFGPGMTYFTWKRRQLPCSFQLESKSFRNAEAILQTESSQLDPHQLVVTEAIPYMLVTFLHIEHFIGELLSSGLRHVVQWAHQHHPDHTLAVLLVGLERYLPHLERKVQKKGEVPVTRDQVHVALVQLQVQQRVQVWKVDGLPEAAERLASMTRLLGQQVYKEQETYLSVLAAGKESCHAANTLKTVRDIEEDRSKAAFVKALACLPGVTASLAYSIASKYGSFGALISALDGSAQPQKLLLGLRHADAGSGVGKTTAEKIHRFLGLSPDDLVEEVDM